jgi:hypothetical protein
MKENSLNEIFLFFSVHETLSLGDGTRKRNIRHILWIFRETSVDVICLFAENDGGFELSQQTSGRKILEHLVKISLRFK